MKLSSSDAHLDWLSATTQTPVTEVVDVLLKHVRGAIDVRSALPVAKAYKEAFEVIDWQGDSLCRVEAGASHGWTLVTATGTQPNAEVREALRLLQDGCRATRLDSAIDMHGDFVEIAAMVEAIARQPLQGTAVRAFERWESPNGSTLYVGARQSAARVRVYQKGYEQRAKGNADAPLDWVRVELQWRPQKEQRMGAMDLSAAEIWGAATKWTAEVGKRLLCADLTHATVPAEMTTFETTYAWALKAASKTLQEAVRRYGLAQVLSDLQLQDN